jgi:hypothetical protein
VKSRYKEAIKEAQTIPEGSLNKKNKKNHLLKNDHFLKGGFIMYIDYFRRIRLTFLRFKDGSAGRTRTYDRSVNSR